MGVSLNSSGVLSESFTTAGTYPFTLRAATAYGSDTQAYTFRVGAAPAVATAALPNATVGAAYRLPVAATGDGTVTVAVTGLPSGLSFDASTGIMSASPTAAGTAR